MARYPHTVGVRSDSKYGVPVSAAPHNGDSAERGHRMPRVGSRPVGGTGALARRHEQVEYDADRTREGDPGEKTSHVKARAVGRRQRRGVDRRQ